MYRPDPGFPLLADKLSASLPRDADHHAALAALPHVIRTLRAGEFVVREEDQPHHGFLLLSGFTVRHKVLSNGARQILALHMSGDLIDLHQAVPTRADHNIQALSAASLAFVPLEAIRELAERHPAIGQAMWQETLIDAATSREWMLNIGRRDARTRTAHLLCEVGTRLRAAGLGERDHFTLPFTQEQMADAMALTNVHVSRMFATLTAAGLIERHNRQLTILDFGRLATVGDFDPRYLRLERYNNRLPN
jgi:CRP-like cAMP-binding protein